MINVNLTREKPSPNYRIITLSFSSDLHDLANKVRLLSITLKRITESGDAVVVMEMGSPGSTNVSLNTTLTLINKKQLMIIKIKIVLSTNILPDHCMYSMHQLYLKWNLR